MRKGKSDNDMQFERAPIERERATLRIRLRRLERATTLHAQNFLVRRWHNLKQVRRVALAWLAVAATLIFIGWLQVEAQRPLYSHQGAAEGGAYIEGAVGKAETLNPIFATNVAERSLSQLLFAGLLRVDAQGDVAGDLAESWSIGDGGRTYTLKLRPGLEWTDGEPITSEDVLFTVDAIQTPAARSPLLSAWRNVKVEAPDERTVKFTLDVPYAPFLTTLRVGILPQHVLSNVPPEQLRNATFNNEPTVTSGPFSYRGTVDGRNGAESQVDVYLAGNDGYHLGAPKLERFTMRIYEDKDTLANAMRDREIMAANDIPYSQLEQFTAQDELKVTKMQPFSGVFAFFKTSSPPLDDKMVRQALRLGSDIEAIASKVGEVTPMTGPLLPGQLGYNEELTQQTNDVKGANQLLDKAGWRKNAEGIRVKDGRELSLRLVSLNSGEYSTIMQALQSQWQKLGVKTDVSLVPQEEFQSNVITPHSYDVLVYELALGRDSDVYAFWHSSQAAPGRLNLSEYRSSKADEALDSGRTLVNGPLRDVKYEAFIEQWLSDTPAIALYRPNLYYVQLAKTHSVEQGAIGDALERFADVHYWTVETKQVYDTR